MPEMPIAERIIKRVEILSQEKDNQKAYWQELAEFCLPSKAYVTRSKVTGRLNFSHLFDNEAVRDLQTMAAGFSSHLTNPSSKWFALSAKDRRLIDVKAVKIWFRDVEEIMFSTLSTSNFESIMGEFYLDQGCFGTAGIFTESDPKTVVRYTSLDLPGLYVEEDDKGRIVRIYREFEYTAQQAYDKWGDNAGAAVAELLKDKNEASRRKKLKFIHAVFPRYERDPSKMDSINMPIASLWVELSKKELIYESGFNEMPHQVGRYRKISNWIWGVSPAMNALDDIKMLSAEKKTLIRAAMKVVDPPFIIPHRGFIQPLNFNPGGPNIVKDHKPDDAYTPILTKANIPIAIEMIEEVKDSIKKAFFVPLFQAFADITKQMTIPEVQRRINENMVLLGPTVGRFTQEVFDPAISRTFMILFRKGLLPPAPKELAGKELDIVYISQLAKAQRLSEINEIENLLMDVQAVAGVLPNVVDNIDGDKVIRLIHKIRRVDPDILRSDKEIEIIRAARAQAEEAQAQLAAAGQVAKAAKDASSAVMVGV